MPGDATPPPELPPGLLAEYLESARSQLGVLAGLAHRIAARSADREALDALRREIHKVHGSAGSYGFMDASRLAAGVGGAGKGWGAPPGGKEGGRGPPPAWVVQPRLAEIRLGGTAPPPVPSRDVLSVPEVIYVEDDAALAELLEYGLRAHGYRFLAYRNGRDALRELLALDVRGTHPLLLLDVDLPALDGYSILAALERERPGTYRVVFTTVHGTEEEQLRGLEAGALDLLGKPVSLGAGVAEIQRPGGGGRVGA